MQIRDAVVADRTAIAKLQAASWRDAYRHVLPGSYLEAALLDDLERHWREVSIGPGDIVEVAEGDGLVGFVAVWVRDQPFIDNLHVLPGHRSNGVGRGLLAAAAVKLIAAGHRTADLHVLDGNHRALRLYERLGGVADAVFEDALFGHPIRKRRVHWPDLATIVEA